MKNENYVLCTKSGVIVFGRTIEVKIEFVMRKMSPVDLKCYTRKVNQYLEYVTKIVNCI